MTVTFNFKIFKKMRLGDSEGCQYWLGLREEETLSTSSSNANYPDAQTLIQETQKILEISVVERHAV